MANTELNGLKDFGFRTTRLRANTSEIDCGLMGMNGGISVGQKGEMIDGCYGNEMKLY